MEDNQEIKETEEALLKEEAVKAEAPQRENTHTWKLFAGMFLGMLMCVIGFIAYKGHFIIKTPFGAMGITLPTYYVFHDAPADTINTTDVVNKISEIEYFLDNEYYYDTDKDEITEGIYKGMIDSLLEDDPYAEYYSAPDYEEQVDEWQGTYCGIGAVVQLDEEKRGIAIVSLMDGPAKEAGICPGDIVTEADGVSLSGMELDEAVSEHIKGPEHSTVELTILRDGKELTFTVERRVIDTVTVYDSAVEFEGKNYGVIYVSQFAGNTAKPFKGAVDKYVKSGAEGIVIDLRDDGGGDMNVCLDMLDYILPDDLKCDTEEFNIGRSLLLQIVMKNGNATRYCSQDGHESDIPIVVLVNENSASASEIFTGVLGSYGYKTVGTKTFGKGIVQNVRTLSDGSGIKYTCAEYVLPDGSRIHGVGITPDVVVEPTEEMYEKGLDPESPDPLIDNQLNAALKLLGE